MAKLKLKSQLVDAIGNTLLFHEGSFNLVYTCVPENQHKEFFFDFEEFRPNNMRF